MTSRKPALAAGWAAATLLLGLGCKAALDTRAADQASSYKTVYHPVAGIETPDGFRAVFVAGRWSASTSPSS